MSNEASASTLYALIVEHSSPVLPVFIVDNRGGVFRYGWTIPERSAKVSVQSELGIIRR